MRLACNRGKRCDGTRGHGEKAQYLVKHIDAICLVVQLNGFSMELSLGAGIAGLGPQLIGMSMTQSRDTVQPSHSTLLVLCTAG